jgi:hypothetical protein
MVLTMGALSAGAAWNEYGEFLKWYVVTVCSRILVSVRL